ncbi:zinc-binding protein A33-like [Notolabrus celidotus]|uniref:zinc-binding protein A33-like n=1 Tax=Notolabrus celidotus TaxID=1203425 RepID=UPI0014904902|nr:zinc-binding protein A33-like [Notolabrus celidotus]
MTTLTVRNMANVPSEVLRCCICLDTYNNPVSIQCGHNFCLHCIEGYWDTRNKSECPLCKETFRVRPELRINRGFAEIVDILKRFATLPNHEEEDTNNTRNQRYNADVPCDICYKHKSKSVKSCLMCQMSYCQDHLTPHLRDAALQRHRLADPDTFPSSNLCRQHNKPLTKFCRKDQTPLCEECTATDHRQHNVVIMERATKKAKTDLRNTKTEIKQMIHAREHKMEQMKNSVYLSKKIKEEEIQRSSQVCTALITIVERNQAELVEEVTERQQAVEKRAEVLLDQLQQEIWDLKTKGNELHHLQHTQNPLHLLQSFTSLGRLPSTREWSDVEVHSDNCVGMMSRAVYKLGDVCQELANRLASEDSEKMHQYAVDITLDPETASGWLVVSPDRKQVSCQIKRQPVTDRPQRFDSCVCILGEQAFTSGRCYWEVEVGDKTDWDLGLARESIKRKGALVVNPDSGYWAICRRGGSTLSACTGPTVNINIQDTPRKVGVFLDYEAGLVSFYDAEAKTHIYTYSGCAFTEALHPYFNPCLQENGKNIASLIISPIEEQVRELKHITLESEV